MDAETRRAEIEKHRRAIHELEAQAEAAGKAAGWPPSEFYLLWHVVLGAMLGALAALISLGANSLAAPLFGQRPLELIRVYLTFPMGEKALTLEEGAVLFVGCLLYLVTGALYGVLFHLLLAVTFRGASAAKRFVLMTLFGLLLWIFNFYLVLSWLQPLLLGGDWIVRLIPPWVAALTHLAFAWTLAAAEVWGRFEPYRRRAAYGRNA